MTSRADWRRLAPLLSVTSDQAAALIRPATGAAELRGLSVVDGGLVHTNLRVDLDRPPGRVLLRLFQRDAAQAQKEAALAALLDGRAAVARFLHFAPHTPVTGRAYAVLEWIEGTRLDLAAAAAEGDDAALAAMGAAAGAALAPVHAVRFDRPGFLTPDLRVPTAIAFDRAGLLAFMERTLREGPGGAQLGAALTDALFAFVAREGGRLDAWLGDPRLTHADCNPSNILVRQGAAPGAASAAGDANGPWRVAALLDWEFALSATPAFDFGNLLRPPLGERPAFAAGLARSYREAGGTLPPDWRRIAAIADLFAWADMLGQARGDPGLAENARRVVAATIAGGDGA